MMVRSTLVAALLMTAAHVPTPTATAHAGPDWPTCPNAGPVFHAKLSVSGRSGALVQDGGAQVVTIGKGGGITVTDVGGQIGSGVFLSGQNGPDGWPGDTAPWDKGRHGGYAWPMPGSPRFSLVGVFYDRATGVRRTTYTRKATSGTAAVSRGAFYVGYGTPKCVPAPRDRETMVRLMVNDDDSLDNDGAFTAIVRVHRRWR
ncbi:hypothetical protein [Nonomuraea roseola]|uniref:Secreted protein n=1 Tax=Nonomuraea roseola TaxID=46179 RepID=A0ABV5PTJ5_9ACTN